VVFRAVFFFFLAKDRMQITCTDNANRYTQPNALNGNGQIEDKELTDRLAETKAKETVKTPPKRKHRRTSCAAGGCTGEWTTRGAQSAAHNRKTGRNSKRNGDQQKSAVADTETEQFAVFVYCFFVGFYCFCWFVAV